MKATAGSPEWQNWLRLAWDPGQHLFPEFTFSVKRPVLFCCKILPYSYFFLTCPSILHREDMS